MDKIVCLGKNYPEHAQELADGQGDVIPAQPVLFLKPPSVLVTAALGSTLTLFLPEHSNDVHPECEIVLQVGDDRKVQGVTVGLDLTLRDLQSQAKKNGQPWTISKVFAGSAVVGPFVPLDDFASWQTTEFRFVVSGELRQSGRLDQALLSASHTLSYIEKYFPLCPGDLIFTGTPRGVKSIAPGDRAELEWGKIHFSTLWQKTPPARPR